MSLENGYTFDKVECKKGVLMFKRTEVIQLDKDELYMYNRIKSDIKSLKDPIMRDEVESHIILKFQLTYIGSDFFPNEIDTSLYRTLRNIADEVMRKIHELKEGER